MDYVLLLRCPGEADGCGALCCVTWRERCVAGWPADVREEVLRFVGGGLDRAGGAQVGSATFRGLA